MKINFNKSPVDNIFELLKRDNPRLKGGVSEFTIDVNVPDKDAIENTFKLTTTKESVYIADESSTFIFDRQNLLYTEGISPIRLEVVSGTDVNTVKSELLELIPNEFKSVIDIDVVVNKEGGYDTKITTKEEWMPYVYGEPKIYVVIDETEPDLPGTYLGGVNVNDTGVSLSYDLKKLLEEGVGNGGV